MIFKTEQPKTKVMCDIETMHKHYVWENYLDVFAPALLLAHVAIGEPHYGRSHVLPSGHVSDLTVGLGVNAVAEFTAETDHNNNYPLRHGSVRRPPYFGARIHPLPYFPNLCTQWHYLHNTFNSFQLHSSHLVSDFLWVRRHAL